MAQATKSVSSRTKTFSSSTFWGANIEWHSFMLHHALNICIFCPKEQTSMLILHSTALFCLPPFSCSSSYVDRDRYRLIFVQPYFYSDHFTLTSISLRGHILNVSKVKATSSRWQFAMFQMMCIFIWLDLWCRHINIATAWLSATAAAAAAAAMSSS